MTYPGVSPQPATGNSIWIQTLHGRPGLRSSPSAVDETEPCWLDTTSGYQPTAYGQFVKASPNIAGTVSSVQSSDANTLIIGVLGMPEIDPLPSILNEPLGITTPNPAVAHGLYRAGRCFVQTVLWASHAPADGAQVYIYTTAETNAPVGSVGATNQTGSVTVPGCTFVGTADANGVCEIRFRF